MIIYFYFVVVQLSTGMIFKVEALSELQ